MEKAPTGAFSWWKAPTSAFTFKTLLLRYYAKQVPKHGKQTWNQDANAIITRAGGFKNLCKLTRSSFWGLLRNCENSTLMMSA